MRYIKILLKSLLKLKIHILRYYSYNIVSVSFRNTSFNMPSPIPCPVRPPNLIAFNADDD